MRQWKCSTCGFMAKDEKERRKHLTENSIDPKHLETNKKNAPQLKQGLPG